MDKSMKSPYNTAFSAYEHHVIAREKFQLDFCTLKSVIIDGINRLFNGTEIIIDCTRVSVCRKLQNLFGVRIENNIQVTPPPFSVLSRLSLLPY